MAKTFLELLEFQGSWNLIGQYNVGGIPELSITKQMSSFSIMSRYRFNIAYFLRIEVWKVPQSDWLKKLLAKCKNSGNSSI